MPRPPVRATERLAKAEELGRLKAKAEMDKKRHKLSGSNIYESLREHLGKIIDNTKINDWAEIVAAIGLTPITYQGLLAVKNLPSIIAKVAGITSPFYSQILNVLQGYAGLGALFGAIITVADTVTKKTETTPTQTQAIVSELELWLLAFGVSYMIVRFGDKLISTSGLNSLENIMGLLGISSIVL